MRKRRVLFILGLIAFAILFYLYVPNFWSSADLLFGKGGTIDITDRPPLVLLHGFQPLYSQRMAELEMLDLQNALDYKDAGVLTDYTRCEEFRSDGRPISIRVNYLSYPPKIENYAGNIAEDIDFILHCTGAEKVDIVAYSMGGIVTRYYLGEYGEGKIRKVVMIGTPNNGGLYRIGEISNEFDDHSSAIDFLELGDNSTLISELFMPTIPVETIAGVIDGKGDGLITEEGVRLDGYSQHVVDCSHLAIKSPLFCKETLALVDAALSE